MQFPIYKYSCYTSVQANHHFCWSVNLKYSPRIKSDPPHLLYKWNMHIKILFAFLKFIITFTFRLQQYSIMSHRDKLKFLVNIDERTPSSKHNLHILFIIYLKSTTVLFIVKKKSNFLQFLHWQQWHWQLTSTS